MVGERKLRAELRFLFVCFYFGATPGSAPWLSFGFARGTKGVLGMEPGRPHTKQYVLSLPLRAGIGSSAPHDFPQHRWVWPQNLKIIMQNFCKLDKDSDQLILDTYLILLTNVWFFKNSWQELKLIEGWFT